MYVYLEGRGNKGRERDLKGEGDEEEEELGFGEEKTTAEEEMQECAMSGPLDSGERERERERGRRVLSNDAAPERKASQNQKILKIKEERPAHATPTPFPFNWSRRGSIYL